MKPFKEIFENVLKEYEIKKIKKFLKTYYYIFDGSEIYRPETGVWTPIEYMSDDDIKDVSFKSKKDAQKAIKKLLK